MSNLESSGSETPPNTIIKSALHRLPKPYFKYDGNNATAVPGNPATRYIKDAIDLAKIEGHLFDEWSKHDKDTKFRKNRRGFSGGFGKTMQKILNEWGDSPRKAIEIFPLIGDQSLYFGPNT